MPAVSRVDCGSGLGPGLTSTAEGTKDLVRAPTAAAVEREGDYVERTKCYPSRQESGARGCAKICLKPQQQEKFHSLTPTQGEKARETALLLCTLPTQQS